VATVYDFPEYYDILFGWDRDDEAEQYERALIHHGVPRGAPLLEVAAGTAQIGIRLARHGWRVTALDLSAAMLGFASDQAQRSGTAIETMLADMTSFRVGQRYSAALNPMSSFRLLQHEDQVAAHLDCMADALLLGGVYLNRRGVWHGRNRGYRPRRMGHAA
jgi:ubiquinone/menaquinone biosynthesis C-methylase UbiE